MVTTVITSDRARPERVHVRRTQIASADFEDGGGAVSQGMWVASRNGKRLECRISLRVSKKEGIQAC